MSDLAAWLPAQGFGQYAELFAGQRWVVWLLLTGLRLDPVSDGFESLTMKMYFDGMVHLVTGGLGTFTIDA